MTARSPEEVRKLVSAGRWKRKHLEAFRQEFGDQALFDALFLAFVEHPPLPYAEQQPSGDYLLELKPRTARPLPDLIRASLTGWNVSVEELPFYFRDVYGLETVYAALKEVASKRDLTQREGKALQTYRYWLSLR